MRTCPTLMSHHRRRVVCVRDGTGAFRFQTHTVRCVVFYMRDSVEERLLALRNSKVMCLLLLLLLSLLSAVRSDPRCIRHN